MTTLANIRAKIRLVTARPSANQLTDAQIDDYVNTFYQYDLPEALKFINLLDHYTFITNPNVDQYDFDRNNYLTLRDPAFCGGYRMNFSQDEQMFYNVWPRLTSKIAVATGDGGAGPYTFTISAAPFLRSSPSAIGQSGANLNVLISAETAASAATSVYDDGIGGFQGAAGFINYVTGAVTNLIFPAPVPVGTTISAQVSTYSASRPLSLLFFQDKITLRPVPDDAYVIQLQAYKTPTAILNAVDNPQLNEWWQLLAYGAALKVFTDYGDFDQLNLYRPYYEEQLLLCNRRTLSQFSNQRISTIYNSNGFPWGTTWPTY